MKLLSNAGSAVKSLRKTQIMKLADIVRENARLYRTLTE